MSIDSLMIDPGSTVYYDEDFRNVLEDHMTYLREHVQTQTILLDIGRVYKYEYDLYGLLASYDLPTWMHWVIGRMNKFTSPHELLQGQLTLLIPNNTVVDRIRQSHMTTRRVS